MRGACFGLDVLVEITAQTESEDDLGDHEHRTDEQAGDVIDEGGLFALVVVTDELDDPADDEAAEADREPGAENTIRGMPTKWVAMLRRSRWYSAY